jgi:hypothetical protein
MDRPVGTAAACPAHVSLTPDVAPSSPDITTQVSEGSSISYTLNNCHSTVHQNWELQKWSTAFPLR